MKKPVSLILRKIIWGAMLVVGLCVFVVSCLSIGRTSSEIGIIFMALGFCCGPALFVAACALTKWAFESEFAKMKLKQDLYIQDNVKGLKEEYVSTEADIHYRARAKRANAYKKGIEVKRCPVCADEVDANEKFCSKCGAEIYKKCKKCKTVNEAGDEFCRNCGNKLKEQ